MTERTKFLESAPGVSSSGRFIKIGSFIMGCVIAICIGATLPFVPVAVASTYANYGLVSTGAFLGLAGGSEVAQKVTGK